MSLNSFRMMLRWIAFPFVQFFRFLEEHAVGILATLLVHLFVITLFLIAKINTTREHQAVMMQIDFERERVEPKEPEPSQKRSAADLSAQIERMRNVPVNKSEAQGVENIGAMVKDIKRELNVRDVRAIDPTQEATQSAKPTKTLANEAKVYDEKYPLNAQGERTVYRGPTTVSYRLENRTHIYMSIPAYKCQGGGTVVVDIMVSRRGYVITAQVKKEISATLDPCFVDAALRAAETARFSAAPTAPKNQAGTITYIFIAQ